MHSHMSLLAAADMDMGGLPIVVGRGGLQAHAQPQDFIGAVAATSSQDPNAEDDIEVSNAVC